MGKQLMRKGEWQNDCNRIVTIKCVYITQSKNQFDEIRNLYAIPKWKGEKLWNM